MLEQFNQIQLQEIFIVPMIILALAVVTYFGTKHYLIYVIHSIIYKRNKKLGIIVDQHHPFRQLSFLAPTIFVYAGIQYLPDFAHYVLRLLNFYIAINLTLLLTNIINTILEIYNLYPIARSRPIKSYVQMGSIFIYIVGGIIAICQLLNKDPWLFISGIGALTAIIIVIFRDTILSFIAGIQILSNNLIRADDWIEVPSFGADGRVIDVALHVIKVQNWDNTVVTMPTYKVIENGFKNWRGMYEAGGRRIKNSLFIDQTSVAFMDQPRLKALHETPLIKTYIQKLLEDIQEKSGKNNFNLHENTNLGIFRKYAEAYLRAHPKINQQFSFLIRLLNPTPMGIPLEIYIFTKNTEWVEYEHTQSEIFEHFLAILPYFGLQIYQQPTGYDIAKLQGISKIYDPALIEISRKYA